MEDCEEVKTQIIFQFFLILDFFVTTNYSLFQSLFSKSFVLCSLDPFVNDAIFQKPLCKKIKKDKVLKDCF